MAVGCKPEYAKRKRIVAEWQVYADATGSCVRLHARMAASARGCDGNDKEHGCPNHWSPGVIGMGGASCP
jgi:hypothetical protein